MRWIRMMLLLPILLISGCWDSWVPGPEPTSCSINPDGSNFVRGDTRLYNYSYGTAHYLSNDLVFYAGTRILKCPLGGAPIAITPVDLTLANNNIIAIDQPSQKLYFAAGGDIYRCGFSGENLTNLSEQTDLVFTTPALSDDRNYLTAISLGKISRLELNTGIWTHLESPVWVRYSIYMSSEDRYYYFRATHSNGGLSLNCLDPNTGNDDRLMLISGWSSELSCGISPDFRFFSLFKREKYWNLEEEDKLMVWDRQDKSTLEIPFVYAYAFSPVDAKLLYSTDTWGLADLRLRDMNTHQELLLKDGIYTPSSYSYLINDIEWRSDGGHIFYKGEMGYRNRRETPNGITGIINTPESDYMIR